jgi:hypothetical protein
MEGFPGFLHYFLELVIVFVVMFHNVLLEVDVPAAHSHYAVVAFHDRQLNV